MNIRKETPFTEYELLEQVGTGSFGSVHKAKRKKTSEIVRNCIISTYIVVV